MNYTLRVGIAMKDTGDLEGLGPCIPSNTPEAFFSGLWDPIRLHVACCMIVLVLVLILSVDNS